MSEELAALIEMARRHKMTEAEMEEQIVSFVYGNAHMENPGVTREGVAEWVRRHLAEKQPPGPRPP